MTVEQPNNIDLDDEAQLDQQLASDIESVRAGNKLTEESVLPEPAAKPEGDAPAEERGDGKPADTNDLVDDDGKFRIPNKGPNESDESYDLRVQLFDLINKKKAATTPEAKAELSKQIADTKKDFGLLIKNESISNVNKPTEETKADEDPLVAADKARLKELGGMTKEDVEAMVADQTFKKEVQDTLANFVERTPELKDQDVLDVFFDFVDANYKWQGKTGKDLMTVLSLAHQNMFKPSESVQDRVLKGAKVQEAVNAMQFPGGTAGGSGNGLTAEQKASVDELKATGMSEADAIELIS